MINYYDIGPDCSIISYYCAIIRITLVIYLFILAVISWLNSVISIVRWIWCIKLFCF